MQYCSTRNSELRVSAAEAIMRGLAPDGGLFVPVEIPQLDVKTLSGKSYTEAAYEVLRLFLPDYDSGFLKKAVEESYGEAFGKAGHLEKLNNGLYSLELWHGPTFAFKDYALQLMPRLLAEARKMLGETDETVILVATSGDTGSAALAGYSNLPGIKIAAFYPYNGVSLVQRLQMTTQEASNVSAYAVRGNFDDAQRGVKRAFTSQELANAMKKRGAKLSSANSINWGRLVPQIVYYITSYLHLVEINEINYGEKVDFCVPTGNFGDIMAGWYAEKMGLPVGRLICASNKNNVLADFLHTGHYDAKRDFYKTSSPSMDILVSSNLERLLFHITENDVKVTEWMKQLTEKGEYYVEDAYMSEIGESFSGGWANEESVYSEISRLFNEYEYLSDPHTAVAFKVLEDLSAEGEKSHIPAVVLSTASPFKFSSQVLAALGGTVPEDEFKAIEELEALTGKKAPSKLTSLRGKAERFTDVINSDYIENIPLDIL